MPKPPQALRPQDAQPAQPESQVRKEVHPLDVHTVGLPLTRYLVWLGGMH